MTMDLNNGDGWEWLNSSANQWNHGVLHTSGVYLAEMERIKSNCFA